MSPPSPADSIHLDPSDEKLDSHSLFTQEQLERWCQNKRLTLIRPVHVDVDPPEVLHTILRVMNPGYKNNALFDHRQEEKLEPLVEAHPQLKELLEARDFKAVMTSKYVLAPLVVRPETRYMRLTSPTKEVVMNSWKTPYVGRDTDTLRDVLRAYMRKKDVYARFASFIQSSGTGKSRMNDELAKQVLYIPVNLSSSRADCFPPSDPDAVQWLWLTHDEVPKPADYQKTVQAFLVGVFSTTRERLEPLVKELPQGLDSSQRVARMAAAFRTKMNEGMEFDAHGEYRTSFYKTVVEKAEQFLQADRTPQKRVDGTTVRQGVTSKPSSREKTVELAATGLVNASALMRTIARRAHSNTYWTRFFELTRALRTIVKEPVFTVFLSAVGRLDRSSQMFPPIVTTPFDILSDKFPLKPSSAWNLKRVASTYHMAHLGRPLFAAVYDAGIQRGIVDYARTKLLKSRNTDKLSDIQVLAGIAVRIPFDLRFMSSEGPSTERALVSDHLRLLLYADAGFARVVTACASEPLLAEAAYEAAIDDRWARGKPAVRRDRPSLNPVLGTTRDLVSRPTLAGVAIDLGMRGEFIAAMLFLDARDRATTFPCATPPGDFGDGDSADRRYDGADRRYDGAAKRRIVTVLQFLEALVPGQHHEVCRSHLPSSYLPAHENTKLADAFANAHVYFNHYIRVPSFETVDQRYLLLAISRGAALICADNQEGFDILIPTLSGTVLDARKASVILVRVKNTVTMGAKGVQPHLFTCMKTRWHTGIFGDSDATVQHLPAGPEPEPVLRLVFAFASGAGSGSASAEPGVVFQQSAAPDPDSDSDSGSDSDRIQSDFTAYDIWFSGASRATFGVVQGVREEAAFAMLLEAVRDQDDAVRMHQYGNPYDPDDVKVTETIRGAVASMKPLASSGDPNHFANFASL